MDVFSDGSSTLPASTKKERHDISRVFLFWVPPPKGQLHPSVIKMLGAAKPPLRNSPLRSEFTPHQRRGPEGPYFIRTQLSFFLGFRRLKGLLLREGLFHSLSAAVALHNFSPVIEELLQALIGAALHQRIQRRGTNDQRVKLEPR